MRRKIAEIYKAKLFKGCSNGGISEYYDNVVCYFLEDGESISDIENPEDNAVVLVELSLRGEKYYVFEPVANIPEGHTGYMSGGSYVGSCDSTFIELCHGNDILPLHDRTETWKLYEALCK